MGAITEDGFFFLLQGLYSQTRFEGLLNKDFISSFFFSTTMGCKWFDNSSLVFFFFPLNCRVALNSVRSSFVQLACQQESIMVKSTIVVDAFQLDESRNLGSPFGHWKLVEKVYSPSGRPDWVHYSSSSRHYLVKVCLLPFLHVTMS